MDLCGSSSPRTAPARGDGEAGGAEAGADGLGTPAGHSPGQGGTCRLRLLCAVQEVILE